MFDREKGGRKRKLAWVASAVVIMVIIAFAVAYVNVSNALSSALSHSLNTFDLASVTYSSVNPGTIDMNITFRMRNPTNYTAKVNTIMLSFWVDERDIGNVNVEPNQDFPPGEESFFCFFRHVTDESVLMSLNNQTYKLTIKGKISASVSYFIFEASRSRDIDSSREVSGAG